MEHGWSLVRWYIWSLTTNLHAGPSHGARFRQGISGHDGKGLQGWRMWMTLWAVVCPKTYDMFQKIKNNILISIIYIHMFYIHYYVYILYIYYIIYILYIYAIYSAWYVVFQHSAGTLGSHSGFVQPLEWHCNGEGHGKKPIDLIEKKNKGSEMWGFPKIWGLPVLIHL